MASTRRKNAYAPAFDSSDEDGAGLPRMPVPKASQSGQRHAPMRPMNPSIAGADSSDDEEMPVALSLGFLYLVFQKFCTEKHKLVQALNRP